MTAIRNIFPIVLLYGFKVVCPPILEESEDYPCLDEKQEYVIVYNPRDLNISRCEQYWNFEKKLVADLHNRPCSLPCLLVSPGEIRLAQCINVTLKMLCSVPGDMVEEIRVHFHGKSSGSQGQRGPKEGPISTQGQNYHIGLCLFVAVGAGCAALFCFIKQRGRPPCQPVSQGPG